MTEQQKILASKNIERQRLASPDAELRAIGHQLLLAHEAFALLHNLVRCDGAGVELPPPARQGRNTWNGATVERRRALDNLPREWRMELAAAIIENRVTPLAAAKAADEA